MQQQRDNPPYTAFFRFVTMAELLAVAAAGIALFFLTAFGRAQWPWHIAPFNALFLGAAYLSSLATIAVMLSGGRWAPGRLGLWMLAAFTVPILLCSLLYFANFDFQRVATWVWYVLFLTIAPYSVFHIWRQRHLQPGNPTTMPNLWRTYLLLQGVLLVVYALSLLAAPTFFSAFWPWKIDEFHGKLYSAIFLTGGIGSLVLWRSAARIELLMLGLTQVVLGLFVILGLVIADASQHRVNWGAAPTWLWIALFSWLFLAGVGLIWLAVVARARVAPALGAAQ